MNTINRLQLRHHTPIFETREDAIEYIYSQIRFADEGLAFEDRRYGFSLLGEPTVLLYKNVTEADPTGENDPHLIIAIGSATNEGTQYNDNRFCIIDIDKTEKEIDDLWEEIERAIRSLTIITRDTNTLKLYSEKTEDGTIVSGDVVVASSQIFDDARKPNIILNTDDGLFTYVNMEYEDDKLFFTVNGDTKEFPINNYYIVRGYYSKKDESLHLIRKDGFDVVISLENLIDEWGVEGEASNTPIVLTREEVGYGDDALHNHVEPWQDVLRGDVRLADRRYNILKKTSDGRYLYVDGLASNITFFKDGQEMSVQEALANATRGVSNDSTNIIYEKADGIYATAMLKYNNKENKLTFTTSNSTGGTSVEEIHLNAVEAFTKVYYDPVTENLIILYKDGSGDIQEVDIPIGEMMKDWEWDVVNEGHNVKLHKQRVINGNDKVSADAAIYDDPDNILVDKNHELFVKGTADNIRYGNGSNVKNELDKLNATDADINRRLNETSGKVDTLRVDLDGEIARATNKETAIENKLDNEIERSINKDNEHDSHISTIERTIGDGFGTDGHETITFKFNELSGKTNVISAKTDALAANLGLLSAKTEAEIVRAKAEEQRIEKKFDDELGDGFNIRNTVRDEIDREKENRANGDAFLQVEINNLSAETKGKLVDVINIDHSINVDKTDRVRPVISVNLSDEKIEGMNNVIKLNNDGLYAGVDLDYYFESGTSKNVLVFKTTNGTKTFDLKTNSVVDKIYYDPTIEAIVIEYTVDGHRMPDVIVPVSDLIEEWRVSESTNGAIRLSLTRVASGDTPHGKDVLYAETVIATHEDNILINDDGALYVSGRQIEINKNDIADLKVRMDIAEDDIDALEIGLANEVARAVSAETVLNDKVDREIERSMTEDDNLREALMAEVARSTEKDNEHDRRITEEINRAQTAEHALHDEIVAETTRAIAAEAELAHELEIETNARISGDTFLDVKIDTEIDRERSARISADTVLNDKIDAEIARATREEQRIENKLDIEIQRSIDKDDEHDRRITQEILRAQDAEHDLHIQITNETARAQGREDEIENNLSLEIQRAQDAEDALGIRLDAETAAREAEDAHIWRVIRPIEFFDTTTIHNERVRNEGANPDEVRHSVIISQADDNIIVANDTLGGIYATARLGYNESANLLTIYGPNDNVLNSVELGPGSIIKDISYDYAEKDLVVTYRRAGDDEDTILKFPVADLFNEWDIQNPSEGSALELHKENQTTETGTVDILWGRVLLTGAVERPDGTIDYGDNIIRIVNNGLYASGTPIIEARRIADCAKNELTVVEEAVLGHHLDDFYPCGSGYTYSPFEEACYINAATSMYDADKILDYYVCSAHTRITKVEQDVSCLWQEVNITQENVIGLVIPPCGINGDGTPYQYPPHKDACFISAATNLMEADVILDQELCRLKTWVECNAGEIKMVENVLGVMGNCDSPIEYPRTEGCLLYSATTFAEADAILEDALCHLMGIEILGSERPTSTTRLIPDDINPENSRVAVDVRLSHGNEIGKWQSDDELVINQFTRDVPDSGDGHTISEFTDTNVLRIIDLTETAGVNPESNFNGLYLSNIWDCGQYTMDGQGTPYEKYRIDPYAGDYYNKKYRNGVRYENG
jgi:hypothetical protein